MSFLDEFDNAESAENKEFSEIDNGEYVAVISNTSLDKTKDPWRVSFEYTIKGGDFDSRKVFANYQVNEKGGPFLKKDLKTLGQDDITSNTLLAAITRVCDKDQELDVYVKQRIYNDKTYYNIYLNGLHTKSAQTELMGDEPTFDNNDEIPF